MNLKRLSIIQAISLTVFLCCIGYLFDVFFSYNVKEDSVVSLEVTVDDIDVTGSGKKSDVFIKSHEYSAILGLPYEVTSRMDMTDVKTIKKGDKLNVSVISRRVKRLNTSKSVNISAIEKDGKAVLSLTDYNGYMRKASEVKAVYVGIALCISVAGIIYSTMKKTIHYVEKREAEERKRLEALLNRKLDD